MEGNCTFDYAHLVDTLPRIVQDVGEIDCEPGLVTALPQLRTPDSAPVDIVNGDRALIAGEGFGGDGDGASYPP
jgi:hypothetical protein